MKKKKKSTAGDKKVNGWRVALCGVHLRVFTESRVSTLESVWVANGFRFPIQGGWGRGWGAWPVRPLAGRHTLLDLMQHFHRYPCPLLPARSPLPTTVSPGAALQIARGLWHRQGFTSISWQCTLSLRSQEMIKVQPVFLLIYLISF